MIIPLLEIGALVGSGIVAGVLFAVALSVVPAMRAMPPDRYVYTHQLLGRNWDPTMPLLVLTTAAADTGLAVVAPAEMLGHSDLSSIGRYVIASSDTMRRGAEAAGRIG